MKALAFVTFVLAYLFVVLGAQVLIKNVLWRPPFYAYAQDSALLVTNAVMFGVFFCYRAKTRNRWINEEAQRFLASHTLNTSTQMHSWRKKMQRRLLWAPTLLVLVVLLFFPEVLGITSHLFGTLSLDRHRLKIPLTWIIADYTITTDDATNAEVGRSIWIVSAKGIGRVGVRKYWRKEEPISEMTFSSYPASLYEPKPPLLAKVLSTQQLPLGDELLTCWDIIPFAATRPMPMNPELAEIVCDSTRNDFHASFLGWRVDAAKFSQIIQALPEKSRSRL